MSQLEKRYSMRTPCANCPFRTDIKPYLNKDRAREIATALASGGEFPCHKTTVPDEDGDLQDDPCKSRHCAGALIMMEKAGASNQAMRFAERVGLYDASKLNMEAPVFDHPTRWIDAQPSRGPEEDAEKEYECCSVCGPYCEWPAGHLINGVAVRGESPDAELPCCEGCGEPMCDGCVSADVDYCLHCGES